MISNVVCLNVKRVVISNRFFSTEVKKWLLDQGYNEQVTQGIIAAYSGKVTMSDVKLLGSSGLKALSDAVQRELKAQRSDACNIDLFITAPKGSNVIKKSVPIGTTFYNLAKEDSDISPFIECACNGIAACSTCHIIIDDAFIKKFPPPEEAELDMLDLAWGVTPNSRLGCQIRFSNQCNGMLITIPEMANNLF